MAIYIISYDITETTNSPLFPVARTANQVRSEIDNHIRTTYPSWAKPLQSVWMVDTPKTSGEIRNEIMQIARQAQGDKILVMLTSKSAWASLNLSQDVVNWLNS